jgi:hypothetical protein
MEQNQIEPQSPAIIPHVRHDGWTGEKMATFCETLAETAVVAEACDAAGMGVSGAYAARRRNPVFAAAWDAALGIARERLADTLLARSMEGNVEQIYKDGELVGERHFLDNRLGLQILRRLDRRADAAVPAAVRPPRGRGTALPSRPIDWSFAVEALRTGDDEGVARALALLEFNEVEEVEGDPIAGLPGAARAPGSNVPLHAEEDDGLDLSDRCWIDGIDDIWMTNFPPPPGFDGYESRPYDDIDDDEPYVRVCTEEEVAILNADRAAERAEERAEDEQLRDEWFALLRAGGAANSPPDSEG